MRVLKMEPHRIADYVRKFTRSNDDLDQQALDAEIDFLVRFQSDLKHALRNAADVFDRLPRDAR